MKKIVGLIGKNIDYSFSKKYFTEKFQKEALPFEYQNFDIKEISEIKEIIKNPLVVGLNVTIPYKEEVKSYLKAMDPVAKAIEAVNVIKINDHRELIGYNSDYFGFTDSIRHFLKPYMKKALILGTGGASKAIAYGLEQLCIQTKFVSRKPKQGQLDYKSLDESIINTHKIIVNCTPLGTYPNNDAHPNIPYKYITSEHLLYDLIYNPSQTTFMIKGQKQGATTCNGFEMLKLQAEKAWEIWGL